MTTQMRVGIEVGGTFTDIVSVHDGRLRIAKVPSVPSSPDVGAMNALSALGIAPSTISDLVHGSTVATNAVLERKGARIAMLVTTGTRDILALQRHSRSSIYNLHYRKPRPVVPRNDIFEISGRLDAMGAEVTPVDIDAVVAQAEAVVAEGVHEVIVICFLNAYRNPAHEQAARAAVERVAPDLPVLCSHEVSREFREYERASTTVLAGFVQPVIKGYLDRFAKMLEDDGFEGRFSVMQSNGGRMPAETMARQPITALLSGPAAGVVGALKAAQQSGISDIITLDVGGTSADVSMVEDGRPGLAAEMHIDGLPIRTPVVDIATVGAGGGSIGWIDDGGMLRVGPQSAGADPGPASYGRGGVVPTVTDANLVRGSLREASFEEIGFKVSRSAAVEVFEGLASELDMSCEDAAEAVIRIAEANIVRAIQQVYTARGKDPRDFALVVYGGAGALHAAQIAAALEIPRVLVPPNAGVLSAAGLLGSDYQHFSVATERFPLIDETLPQIRSIATRLVNEAADYLASEGLTGTPQVEVTLEMRYVGQAFEISVPVSAKTETWSVATLAQGFAQAHHSIFEFSKDEGAQIEVVSYRVGMRVLSPDMPITPREAEHKIDPVIAKDWIVREKGADCPCRVLRALGLGSEPQPGPLLVEDGTTTAFVPVGWTARRDAASNIILELGGA